MLGAPSVIAEPDWTGFWPGILRGVEARQSGRVPVRTGPILSRRRVALAGATGAVTAGLLAVGLWSLSESPVIPDRGHLVELADTEYPDGVMVYSPSESDMTVIWVFDPDGGTGGAI